MSTPMADRIHTDLACCPGCGSVSPYATKLCVSCVAEREDAARREAEAKVQGIQGRYRLDVTA